ncbi:MAG: hypothetical protein F4180_00425 [Chloroflexi bacterium]|nr:hypothetical protein [Chloroflexota bacterium]
MYAGIAEALFHDDTVAATDTVREGDSGSLFRPADGFYIGWIAADFVGGGADRSDIGIGGDMDIDIDLSA